MSQDLLDGSGNGGAPKNLPNANAVLALGIISIATCWLYAIPGIVCGIIAVVLYKKDKPLYDANRAVYEASHKNAKAGNICGIIGLSLSAAYLLFLVIVLFIAATGGGAFRGF